MPAHHAYDAFAAWFDAWQAAYGCPYDDLILPRLLDGLARHAPQARRIVDLGIGTGDLVIALARRGFEVLGVDRSKPMLAAAGAKIAAAALPVPPILLEQDIRELALPVPVDAALCVYTVVNELTTEGDLGALLCGVRAALVPDGVFLFELNLPASYARWWTGTHRTPVAGGEVVRRHSRSADDALIVADVTIRTRTADGERELHDRIEQRPWTDAEIEAALAKAGLTRLAHDEYNPFDAARPPEKALWAARRPLAAAG